MAEILIFFPIHTVYVNQEDSMQGNAYSSLKSLEPSQQGEQSTGHDTNSKGVGKSNSL